MNNIQQKNCNEKGKYQAQTQHYTVATPVSIYTMSFADLRPNNAKRYLMIYFLKAPNTNIN